jgi:hypothetical protein
MFPRSVAPRIGGALALLLLGGCVTLPNGPSVLVLPGNGKTFDQFRFDEQDCRNFALAQTGGTPASQAAVNAGVASAAIGTAVGAAAGAAIGGGSGAGIGAGSGLVLGSLLGTGFGQDAYSRMQQQYDFAFQQCMYAKGHRVPVAGVFPQQPQRAAPMTAAPPAAMPPAASQSPVPQPGTIPPPPAGTPPPPPPR